ncbi:tail fiber domain-containing protein [Limnobacter sp.]|uniref:tail fiber domain-containing protein n=1 Tax=Limnobacter sp. TaxID=2003368 RepID=UPI0025C34039|nr:tail fiber domain-containing protein [Limnobacter sp.]
MSIKLKGSSDGSVSFDAPADTSPSGSDITLTLPTSAGSADQFLKNSGIAGELEYSSMVETSTGVGIGTSSPGEEFVVRANAPSIQLESSNASGRNYGFQSMSDGKFHIYDGTAGANRITMDSSGRVLLGTTSSRGANFNNGSGVDSQFLLEGTSFVTSFANIVRNSNDANSAGFALSKSRGTSVGSNTIVQSGDKLGEIAFQGSDGAKLVGAADIECQVDGTPGTSDMPGRLVFSTTADGAGSSTERMRVTSGGAVRIGDSVTANAAGKFQVVEERSTGDDNDCNAYFETSRADWNIKTYYNRAGTHYHLVFVEQGTERGSIRGSDGSNVTFNQGSDYRWKENIVEMTGAEGIEVCKRLKPSKYNWIENREQTGEINTVDGFIAHEVVEAGVLGAVVGEKDAVNEDGSIKGQLLDYGQMTPVLSAGIKGLIAKVETLETQNTAQQAQIDDLLARVTALEAA